jgi:hypothetical protein
MDQSNPKPPSHDRMSDINDPREPYEPPAMQVDELFEQLALACAKITPVQPSCRAMGGTRLS